MRTGIIGGLMETKLKAENKSAIENPKSKME
jgi:hypothetical protein